MLVKQRFAVIFSREKPAQSPSQLVWRNFLTHCVIRRAASSTSAALKSGLKLNRIAECNTSPDFPIAVNTGDGSSEPLEHAEPVEQATPARSRLINSASALQPGNEILSVCGNPASSGPLRMTGLACSRKYES